MLSGVNAVSAHISRHTSLYVIGTAFFAMLLPDAFAWVRGNVQTLILGFIMLSMGLTLTVDDFRVLVSRPFDIVIGTLAQFSIMPFVAFGITWLVGLDKSLAVGIILVGCCPGGVSSNIMSFLCKGDVAFSVGMTTVSTLLAPVVTPLLVLLLAGQTVDVDAMGMFQNILVVTILPVGIGFLFNWMWGHQDSFVAVRRVMPGFSVVGLALIVGGVVCSVHEPLVNNGLSLFAITFAVVLAHNSFGYLLGYLVGKLFKFSTAKKRTVSIEIGMQNAGLATNLASNFFMATHPLAVVPCAISCAWHSISGTLLATFFANSDQRKDNNIRLDDNVAMKTDKTLMTND